MLAQVEGNSRAGDDPLPDLNLVANESAATAQVLALIFRRPFTAAALASYLPQLFRAARFSACPAEPQY